MKAPFRIPDATYRFQLQAAFNFEQLAAVVPYLHDLGISDVYASPLFRASPGSTHGYDVCDHNEISPELGGIDGLMKVGSLLQEKKMGLLVDFVPNHMGIEGPFNWRWIDVLENGHLSPYASFFDIHWNPRQASLQDRILVPMLHDFYGRVLEEGGIQLRYAENAFWVGYASLRFPLKPDSYGTILDRLAWFKNPGSLVAQKLEALAQQFRSLPDPTAGESIDAARQRNRERDSLRQDLVHLLASEHLGGELESVLKALNGTPGQPSSFNNLHQILEEQNYRLGFWKSGTHEINYRRFFAVDTLVGLHMEQQEVFDETHRLLKYLTEKGVVTGVRIDHIDGLWDPAHYLQRLSNLGAKERAPLYVLVEKILTGQESMPREWAVHGTTGYEFAGSLINLLIDAGTEQEFTRIYREFSRMTIEPHELAYELKLFIMEEMFPNAIDHLVEDVETHVKSDRRWRDWTGNDLRLALSRIIACLAVYRTYRRVGHKLSSADLQVVERAVAATLKRNHSSDPMPFLFIRDLWTGAYPDAHTNPDWKKWADLWVAKLQQYTGAIMAKSMEDTFFYRYVRLFAANEVGHHPAEYGRPVAAFHEENRQRLQHLPAGMLSTSTHDTKMSEDARARLLALSEMPERWAKVLAHGRETNRGFKTKIGEALAPSDNEEYLLYQILLGAWPLDETELDDVFLGRIRSYMRKALSESKANTNWASPNEPWSKATDDFVEALLDPNRAAKFHEEFLPLAREVAERGMKFSLVQLVLKLTSPGVPDIYQGCELWDFSLVDPDNRRPVDFELRRKHLESLHSASLAELLESRRDGRIKMHVLRSLLHYRREHPGLFSGGSYQAVDLEGPEAEKLVAFLRHGEGEQLLVLARIRLGAGNDSSLDETTTLSLSHQPGTWHDLLSPRKVETGSAPFKVSELLNGLPVAVFRAEPAA